jgi:polysaccharide pyruvyl transferase WcaK-like protein
MHNRHIQVIGWYDKGNCGDESYKLSFPKLFPSYDFTFSDKICNTAGAHVLGGGDIVCEAFINVLKSANNKHIMSATMSNPDVDISDFRNVWLRDNRSIEIAAKSGIKAHYCPDFAFALKGDAERGRRITKALFKSDGADHYSKTVAVIINGHLSGDHQQRADEQVAFQHMSYKLAKMMDTTNASFIFLPFGTKQPWDDRTANANVASKCKFFKKNTIVYSPLDVQNTLDVIAGVDAVISTRLHASIFAIASETPFIDITHNHKNLGLLETLNLMELSVSYGGFDAKRAAEILNRLLMNGGKIRDALADVATQQRSKLREFVQYVRFI